jgi:hypothetical protein
VHQCPTVDGKVHRESCELKAQWIAVGEVTAIGSVDQGKPLGGFGFVKVKVLDWEKAADEKPARLQLNEGWCVRLPAGLEKGVKIRAYGQGRPGGGSFLDVEVVSGR